MFHKNKINNLIFNSVGPSPWYWKTFPNIFIENTKYYWQLKELSKYMHAPYLTNDIGEVKLLVGTYARVFPVQNNIFGIWYYTDNNIFIRVFDVNKLKSFDIEAITEDSHHNQLPYVIVGEHVSESLIDISLNAGIHEMEISEELKPVKEIFCIVNGNKYRDNEATIFLIKPNKNEIEVLPQLWFNSDKFDIGYQWITRVVRDPKSKIIYGDGIRIKKFKLKKDNCSFDKWLDF